MLKEISGNRLSSEALGSNLGSITYSLETGRLVAPKCDTTENRQKSMGMSEGQFWALRAAPWVVRMILTLSQGSFLGGRYVTAAVVMLRLV